LRSAGLTLPGYVHDSCSAIHPLALGSPFFASLSLDNYGLEWIHPPYPLAHPLDDGSAVVLDRSLDLTARQLEGDGEAYKLLIQPLVNNWEKLANTILGPFRFPQHPLLAIQFAFYALRSSSGLSRTFFKQMKTKSLFAGLAAHSILPLNKPLTAAFGMILGALGHIVGWPFPKGGSQKIADALITIFKSYGGQIYTESNITRLEALPPSKIILCDVTPKQLLQIAGDRLPERYAKKLAAYRYGPGVFKIDWALNNPIPWKAKECSLAGTIHLGGTALEIERSEQEVWQNKYPKAPYIILAQHSLFDPSRSPLGKHTAWAYCHVPNGSTVDMTDNIEAQIERFAPGFKDCIVAKSTRSAHELESYNPNCIGGDINGGVQDLQQLFTRPVAWVEPYSTPIQGLYLCSSSTPPGGGVHGMCGYHAALAALKGGGPWEKP
jgi:phytoene dehydrogenase-like protein